MSLVGRDINVNEADLGPIIGCTSQNDIVLRADAGVVALVSIRTVAGIRDAKNETCIARVTGQGDVGFEREVGVAAL